MTRAAISHVGAALSYVLVGFLVLTGMGLAHHEYWSSTVVAFVLAVGALPSIWGHLFRRFPAVRITGFIYSALLCAGLVGMFALAEDERSQRAKYYSEHHAEIIEQAQAAITGGRLGVAADWEARYRHVQANRLTSLVERARTQRASQASENSPIPGSDERSPAQENLLEKLKRQRVE